jgi:anti-sigma factor RsiW
MTHDQLEFLISQYLDGTLPAEEKAALEQSLTSNVEAQQILSEYRSLNDLLRTQLPALPEINWDQFANDTSRAIAEEEAPVLRMRIFTWSRLAIAASVILALGIGFLVSRHGGTLEPAKPQSIARIEGPSAQAATQPAVAQISVGPANELAESQYPLDGIVMSPSSVSLIASNDDSAQDIHRSPYQR